MVEKRTCMHWSEDVLDLIQGRTKVVIQEKRVHIYLSSQELHIDVSNTSTSIYMSFRIVSRPFYF